MPELRERMAYRVCFRDTSLNAVSQATRPNSSGPEVPYRPASGDTLR
jgi:hypothetical protein